MSIERLLNDRVLERVEPDEEGAAQALDEATKHASSAELISPTDPNGAFQLAYDGARKAVTASLRREGLRVRKGEGSHQVTAQYAAMAIDAKLGERLERARRRRNRSEYGSAFFTEADVLDLVELVRALVDAVG